ncbi:MAG TPA: hypothetical protein VFQ28_08905 [Gaiella sp.]|nr:hypothetical protein [Gaiella sp.]
MRTLIRKTGLTLAALGALALGGAALANATDGSTGSSTATSSSQAPPGARPQREPLASDVAAKVKAATLEKVPGATVLRAEAGGPYGTAYHAHIRTADGTEQVVLVSASFEATAVEADRGPGPGRGGPRGGETELTGETKSKVEAAVKARYPGATIVRTETNGDSAAPHESHIATSGGSALEVLVSAGFEVVDAREHPPHP